jgi:hypothetical protein
MTSGRQIVGRTPEPVDRAHGPAHDYLALHTGTSFELLTGLVFSTISPSDVADEAFLRRLGYKVYVGRRSTTASCCDLPASSVMSRITNEHSPICWRCTRRTGGRPLRVIRAIWSD